MSAQAQIYENVIFSFNTNTVCVKYNTFYQENLLLKGTQFRILTVKRQSRTFFYVI